MSVGALIQISITMIKFCSSSICQPLLLLFAKKEIHKSSNTTVQFLYNLSVISVLRNHYSTRYSGFRRKLSYSTYQFGFKLGNSCINQLFSTTHEIYNSSDWGYEVRGVSLDISKALDKVWHDAMFKLEKKDISGNLRDVLPKTKGSVKRTSLSLSKVTTETTQSSNHCSFFLTLMIYQKIYP